jgi:hypothetical protein
MMSQQPERGSDIPRDISGLLNHKKSVTGSVPLLVEYDISPDGQLAEVDIFNLQRIDLIYQRYPYADHEFIRDKLKLSIAEICRILGPERAEREYNLIDLQRRVIRRVFELHFDESYAFISGLLGMSERNLFRTLKIENMENLKKEMKMKYKLDKSK